MSIGPDLSALIAGAGAGSGPAPFISLPPHDQTGMMAGPPGGGGSEVRPLAILRQMIQLAQQYIQVEPDEEDKATMAKLHATLQQYLAKDQADTQKALGGDSSVARVLRKAGAGGP